jgi:hypothetical protein
MEQTFVEGCSFKRLAAAGPDWQAVVQGGDDLLLQVICICFRYGLPVHVAEHGRESAGRCLRQVTKHAPRCMDAGQVDSEKPALWALRLHIETLRLLTRECARGARVYVGAGLPDNGVLPIF